MNFLLCFPRSILPRPTEIHTLSLHDALPIWRDVLVDERPRHVADHLLLVCQGELDAHVAASADGEKKDRDRKSTRLNSSHSQISYAVFCLKKKNIRKMKAKNAAVGHVHAIHELPVVLSSFYSP